MYLGLNTKQRTTPWEGACGVHSTVLAEAAIRFQAETMSETFPAGGPVRVKVHRQKRLLRKQKLRNVSRLT